jgi:phosphoglycolate phosphatase-like HAD superfamily hydrolase
MPAKKTGIKHAIFDHDGTISTLREGWEKIMAPVMIRAILGEKYSDTDENTLRKVEERVSSFIDATTGIQTISQMRGLLDLIREFGFIPEYKILSEKDYKKIFNDELLVMVMARVRKFQCGELGIEDLTIKNVVPFLQHLYDRGINLYLASGTDVEDVKYEASVLGYDHFFGNNIFGATGDLRTEAKKIVLDKILDTIGESGSDSLVTFGDGPVEIRETKKRGGIAIGVASDEMKRFALNEKKRSRLIKAGSDVIIPDFTQFHRVLSLLNLT